MKPPRRALMLGAAAASVAVIVPVGWRILSPELRFVSAGVPGYRQLADRAPPSVSPALVGFGVSGAGPMLRGKALCAALHPPWPDGLVPLAFFTDHYCSFCRTAEPQLTGLDGIRLIRQDLPLLGPSSIIAARAALAAEAQDAGEAMRARLLRTPAALDTPLALRIGDELGLDTAQMRRDMEGDAVAGHLARSAAVARSFGFVGTPSMVVGSTVIEGAVPLRLIQRVVDAEARDGFACPA